MKTLLTFIWGLMWIALGAALIVAVSIGFKVGKPLTWWNIAETVSGISCIVIGYNKAEKATL